MLNAAWLTQVELVEKVPWTELDLLTFFFHTTPLKYFLKVKRLAEANASTMHVRVGVMLIGDIFQQGPQI